MTAILFDSQSPLDLQLHRVKDAIRAEPSKASLRTYYFQLLAVLGDWDRALAQLQVPTRYPLQAHDDDGLRLARRTEWSEISDDHVAGSGQRMWVSDQGDHALLDVRTISFVD